LVVVGASQLQLLEVETVSHPQLFFEALKEPELPGQVQLFMGVARCPVMQLQLFSLQAQLLTVESPDTVE
jgi:hypothetical protein